MTTKKLIHSFHNIFNMLKGFTAGYKSSNDNQMLIENEGVVYKVTIEAVGEGTVEDFIDKEI